MNNDPPIYLFNEIKKTGALVGATNDKIRRVEGTLTGDGLIIILLARTGIVDRLSPRTCGTADCLIHDLLKSITRLDRQASRNTVEHTNNHEFIVAKHGGESINRRNFFVPSASNNIRQP